MPPEGQAHVGPPGSSVWKEAKRVQLTNILHIGYTEHWKFQNEKKISVIISVLTLLWTCFAIFHTFTRFCSLIVGNKCKLLFTYEIQILAHNQPSWQKSVLHRISCCCEWHQLLWRGPIWATATWWGLWKSILFSRVSGVGFISSLNEEGTKSQIWRRFRRNWCKCTEEQKAPTPHTSF